MLAYLVACQRCQRSAPGLFNDFENNGARESGWALGGGRADGAGAMVSTTLGWLLNTNSIVTMYR